MDLSDDPEFQKALQEENLRYFSDNSPGFFRQKLGRSFAYYDLEGKRIKDKTLISRINGLIIPPAWKNVWICPKGNGHLQATGIDSKGRKQYIYHKDWIKISQENKFSKMIDFGLNLPKIRSKVRYDLDGRKFDKKKILATIIWLLENTFLRIGNEEYSKENNSFGLTTLRNRHVKVTGSKIFFRFIGKKGVLNCFEISNPAIAKTIKQCIELPGYNIFQFFDDKGEKHVVDSEDVNLFLKDVTKDDFSAKDFRTWGATQLCANYFNKLGNADNKESLKKNIVSAVKQVATHLNNTVSVCKNYYIHPTVVNSYTRNILIPHFSEFRKSEVRGLNTDEYALVRLLQKYP